MHESSKRRKQSKPTRQLAPSEGPDFTVSLGIPANSLFGPFEVVSLDGASETRIPGLTLEFIDAKGQKHRFAAVTLAAMQLARLRTCQSIRKASGVLFRKDEKTLFLLTTCNIQKIDDVIVTFVSSLDFVSPVDELKEQIGVQEEASPNAPTTSSEASPQPLLLPVAVHDEDASTIRLLGPMQSFLPVAIPRSATRLPSQAVAVNGMLNAGFSMENGQLLLKSDSGTVDMAIHIVDDQDDPGAKFPRLSSTAGVLDLSTKSSTPSPPTPTPGPARRFRCVCGIEFVSEATYTGHRDFYCRMRPRSEAESSSSSSEAFPRSRVPERCPQCEFKPSSASQLSQHVRQAHAAVKAYVCTICGYRGYSYRGIRCHIMRIHLASVGHGALESFVDRLFIEVTADSPKYPCERCKLSFPTVELVRAHACAVTSN